MMICLDAISFVLKTQLKITINTQSSPLHHAIATKTFCPATFIHHPSLSWAYTYKGLQLLELSSNHFTLFHAQLLEWIASSTVDQKAGRVANVSGQGRYIRPDRHISLPIHIQIFDQSKLTRVINTFCIFRKKISLFYHYFPLHGRFIHMT